MIGLCNKANERMKAQVVCDALNMAIHNQKPLKSLIVL